MAKGFNIAASSSFDESLALHPVYRFNRTNHYTPAEGEPSPFYELPNSKHPWVLWKKKLSPEMSLREISFAMHSLIRWLVVEPPRYPEILGNMVPPILTDDGHISLGWLIFARYTTKSSRLQAVHNEAFATLTRVLTPAANVPETV